LDRLRDTGGYLIVDVPALTFAKDLCVEHQDQIMHLTYSRASMVRDVSDLRGYMPQILRKRKIITGGKSHSSIKR